MRVRITTWGGIRLSSGAERHEFAGRETKEGDFYEVIIRELKPAELKTLLETGSVKDHTCFDEFWDVELIPDPDKVVH